ncbi:MAG: L-histidine N(alpha)-methyltransferase [Myxococcota bacterium]
MGTFNIERVSAHRQVEDLATVVRFGLTQPQKELRPIFFYDARGSELFERICRTPEYYVTRTEHAILERYAAEIVDVGPLSTLYELGSGNAEKSEIVIRRALQTHPKLTYWATDISEAALQEAAQRLTQNLPTLSLKLLAASYQDALDAVRRAPAPHFGMFLGGNIGNFPVGEASGFLADIANHASPGDRLLLGFDQIKDLDILISAYDDEEGVTAEFNKNALLRINRELGGNFDPDRFEHLALWSDALKRIEMHLVSTVDQTVRIEALDMSVPFQAGETIHTENSHKYSLESFYQLTEGTGWIADRHWTDDHGYFSVIRLKKEEPAS